MTTPDEPTLPDAVPDVRAPLHRSLTNPDASTEHSSTQPVADGLLAPPSSRATTGVPVLPPAQSTDARSHRISPLVIAVGVLAGGAALGGFALFAQGDTPSSSRAPVQEQALPPAGSAESDDGLDVADTDASAGSVLPSSSAPPTLEAPVATVAPATTAAPATTTPVTTTPVTTTPATTSTPDADPSAGAETTTAPDASDETDPSGGLASAPVEESRAVVRGGQMFFTGAVPTAEIGEEIVALAANILGEENVFNDYVVDPAAGDPNLGNIIVEDTITFAPDSAVLNDSSTELLSQGFALMTIRPAMTVTVVGHTDSAGNNNLELSQRRAEAVKQWFVDQGIDPNRIDAVGRGETEPVASNDTAEGRRLNRRIQFFLENVLGD